MLGFMLLTGAAALGLVGLLVLAQGGSLIPAGASRRWRQRRLWASRQVRTVATAAIVGVAVLGMTRWLAAAVAAGVVVALWPRIIGGGAAGRRQLAKIEAIAAWTEALRDTSAAASGLEQAIPATVSAAPALLLGPLRDLTARLDGRVPLPEALARFADDLDDPAADMVVAALSLNARQRAGGLERILTELAASSRAELEMRRKVEHQRRSVRRQSQQIAGAGVGFVLLQAAFAHSWVAPYSTVTGQIVLLVIGGLFVGAFARMRALAEPETPERFLTAAEEITEIASYKPRGLRIG